MAEEPAEEKRESNPQPPAAQPAEGSREAAGGSTASVKVLLVPDGHVMTLSFPIGLCILDLKHNLAAELRVPAKVLRISLDGAVLDDRRALMELGALEVSSTHPDTYPLHPFKKAQNDDIPEVLTVQVQTDEGEVQELQVEIERPGLKKMFLGGYRHQLTGVEFHHAAMQTLPKKRPDRGVEVFSRDTQTVDLSSQEQQCGVDVSTQMTKAGCYISCCRDRLVSPGNYVTAGEYLERRLQATIRLQAFVRRWLAQQKVDLLRMERDCWLTWQEEQVRRRREEKKEQLLERHRRWSNPQRRDDFNQLYCSVAKWRMEVEQQICSSLTGAEKKAALCSLVQFETEQIATIERRQNAARARNHDNNVRRLLDKSAASHRWPAAGGQTIEVDNEQILRARELRDAYTSISLRPESPEQRERVLRRLRATVQEHPCQLTDDITGLLDRELDLMQRGVGGASLEGLRQRISTLLLQFIKTPEFNPEVAKHLQTTSQKKSDMLLCRSCHRFQLATKFGLPAGCQRISRCRACTALDHVSRARRDVCSYKNLLLRLRTSEQLLGGDATISFLLQVEDVQYLVEDVWTFCPAKESSHLDRLDFVRWDRRKAWSPWNCILLPKEETSSHLEVKDLEQVYEAVFIRSVEYKHLLAWRHFSRNPAMVDYLGSHPAAGPSLQLLSAPVSTATDGQAAVTTSAT